MSDAHKKACGMIAMLGWDLNEFWKDAETMPREVLDEALKMLDTPNPPGMEKSLVDRAKHGLYYVKRQLHERFGVGEQPCP